MKQTWQVQSHSCSFRQGSAAAYLLPSQLLLLRLRLLRLLLPRLLLLRLLLRLPPLQLCLEEVGRLHTAGLVHPICTQLPTSITITITPLCKGDSNEVEVWAKGASPRLPPVVAGQRVGAVCGADVPVSGPGARVGARGLGAARVEAS